MFELEADTTITSEYVLMRHFFGEPVDAALEAKVAAYLRRTQGPHDGWALFYGGDFDISASVKAYFALKMIGDDIDAPHMRRAREAIRARGGAEQSNVFTRVLLALFGVVTWRAVPVMPVEIMHAAEMVSVPYRQGVVLGPHGDRTDGGGPGVQAEGAQSQRHRHRRTVPERPALARPALQGAAPELVLVPAVPRHRRRCCA